MEHLTPGTHRRMLRAARAWRYTVATFISAAGFSLLLAAVLLLLEVAR